MNMGEFYGNLKIDNGMRKIGVNDEGDYIELSVNDKNLTERFADLLKWMDEEGKNLEEKGKGLVEKHGNVPLMETDAEGKRIINTPVVCDVIKEETDLYRRCCEKIDYVFGADTCRKVFGNVVPDEVLIWEFFEQMSTVLEKMSAERGEKISSFYDRRKKKRRKRLKEELVNDHKKGM